MVIGQCIIDIGSRRNEFADEMWIDQDATEYRNDMKVHCCEVFPHFVCGHLLWN